MRKWLVAILLGTVWNDGFCWGFYGHRLINHHAVFLLPPEMIAFYKPNIDFIESHSVDPDKRRYAIPEEGPRHYIDMDNYETINIRTSWKKAVELYSEDSLVAHGIAPWWIQVMLKRLTNAFRDRNAAAILKISAETGHYLADIHVPLHTSSNHNGQYTDQHGIHGFWESRLPELYAENNWDLYAQRCIYIRNPLVFVWDRVYESANASDSVLRLERKLNDKFAAHRKYSFEARNGTIIKQYSSAYSLAYNEMLDGMVERRMKESIYAIACFWFTAWVNAGQPDLKSMIKNGVPANDELEFKQLEMKWKTSTIKGRACD
jgi:hypothetical protein